MRGGPHTVGTKMEEETPPSRVWSEGGVWGGVVVRKGKRNPSDSRLERGRGVGTGQWLWSGLGGDL
jgi:hypothetical protein